MLSDRTKAIIKEMCRKANHPATVLSIEDVVTQRVVDNSLAAEVEIGGNHWLLVYGLEERPGGLARHLSLSHGNREHLPDPRLVAALMQEFEFDETRPVGRMVGRYPNRGNTLHVLQTIAAPSAAG